MIEGAGGADVSLTLFYAQNRIAKPYSRNMLYKQPRRFDIIFYINDY